jgi:hypothetical protein
MKKKSEVEKKTIAVEKAGAGGGRGRGVRYRNFSSTK